MNGTRRIVVTSITACLLAMASLATAEEYQGKKISAATEEADVYSPIASFPSTTFTTVTSVGVPRGYKSKSGVLDITATVQLSCNASGGSVISRVSVGSEYALPSGSGDGGYSALVIADSVVNVTRSFVLLPESAGGPAIAKDATVALELLQYGSNCEYASAALTVRATK